MDIECRRYDREDWVDIAYSEDDGGWYGQRHRDDAVTEVYESRERLLEALENGSTVFTL